MNKEVRIKITKEELSEIITCFEKDREVINQKIGYDENAEMCLHLLKSFEQQILENQENADKFERMKNKIRDKKKFHLICEGNAGSDSNLGKHHHSIWEELNQIYGNES